jgi:putative DNA primase/helicase
MSSADDRSGDGRDQGHHPEDPFYAKRNVREGERVVLINAADIEPENVNWTWRHWLQSGAFNLLVGPSTAGKLTIALSFSATITSGGQWPDRQAAGEPARVVFWSGEDGVKETLMPRFLAAGGDRSNMYFIEGVSDGGRKRPFDPAIDMPKLTQAVVRLKDVRLIVLDPVAVVVKGDSHKNTETRVGLQPFADLCMQTGAAGLGVHHLTKNTAGGNPLERVIGSVAFHALPRCVLVAARDLNGGRDGKRALMRAKVSNGPDWGGLDYKLEQRPLDDYPAIEAQRILWGDTIDGSTRDILAQFEAKPTGVRQRQTVLFLTAALARGPRLAVEVIAEAAKVGIIERTLRYAYKAMGGQRPRPLRRLGVAKGAAAMKASRACAYTLLPQLPELPLNPQHRQHRQKFFPRAREATVGQ